MLKAGFPKSNPWLQHTISQLWIVYMQETSLKSVEHYLPFSARNSACSRPQICMHRRVLGELEDTRNHWEQDPVENHIFDYKNLENPLL